MKPNVQLGSEEAFFKLLAAATIEPSLQSLIAFDTLDSGLINLANQFGKLLAIACNISAPVDILILDSATTEETLWARFGKCDEGIGWKFSLLVQHDRQEQHKPLLVVIPDLTRLSLPAARACIALLDSETATLQRQGIDLTWRPHFWCLAGCQRDRIGEISSHLLDRFALRVTPPISIHTLPSLAPLERFQWFDNIGNNLTSDEVELPAIAVELAERLREILTATDAMPYLSPKVSDRVLAYFREKRPPGMRRVLTLGRLARALSRLAGENIISVERVERAAQLLGIAQNLPAISSTSSKETNDTKNTATVEPTQDRSNTPLKKTDEVATAKVEQIENVVKPDVTTTFPDAEVTKIEEINSYPEDDSQVDHDLEPLKLPMIESRSPRMGFGHPIGTQSATTLEDISLYGTALEAAKFQRYRNNLPCFQQESPRFRIWRSDLRSYRRR
jgi:magnesium chelatase subunit D